MKRRLRFTAVLMLGAMCAAASLVEAQQAPVPAGSLDQWLGRPVASVRVDIEGRPSTDASLFALIEVRAGAPLAVTSMRESVAHLYNLGRFEDVQVAIEAAGEGLVVTFNLTPLHPVNRLEFRGNLGLERRILERGVLEQFSGRPTPARLQAARAALTRILLDEGYYQATVVPSLESTHELHQSTLVFTVEAGPRQRIGRISVIGGSPFSESQIIDRLGLAAGRPYRRRLLDDALRKIADDLRARSFYEAAVSQFASGEGDVVDLTVNVDAGPLVRIVIDGDLPSGKVEDWVPIKRENSADLDLLEDSAFRIRSALQREGYWLADVQQRREEQLDAGRVTVTFTIRWGLRYRVQDVTISGNTHFSTADVHGLLDLKLGEPFHEDLVSSRAGALVNAYTLAGFDATVDILPRELPEARTETEGRVVVHLAIVEGPARTVSAVEIRGAVLIPEAEVRREIRSQPGQPYLQAQVARDREAIGRLYHNRGFPSVTVAVREAGDPTFHITFEIVEGTQIFVDDIIVIGNERVHLDTIMRQIVLRPGQPLGLEDRLESQRRLNELNAFRRVSITPAPASTGETRVDVVVQLEEAPATTIGFGGGLEFAVRTEGIKDRLEIAPRGFFEIGRRNLFGGNRSINLLSRLSLKQRAGRGLGFNEYRVTTTYREPRAFGTPTEVVLSATAEQTIRRSYSFVRRAFNAEALQRPFRRATIFGRYALDSTRLFETSIAIDDQPLIDRLFPQIRLSSVSAGIVWDGRDDPIDPTNGVMVSTDAELAARSIGSEVGFAKMIVQTTGFRRVTKANRVVIGARLQIGVARGFEREVPVLDANGVPVNGPDGQPLTNKVADLPAGRRFFAGGSTSVRGFQLDRLGVPRILNADGLSNGGNGLIVFNTEARMMVLPSVSIVGFVDGGNVFARAGDIRVADLRAAAGFGIRYRSPLGPLRLDFGFKLDRRMVSGKRERGWEFYLSIGEAF